VIPSRDLAETKHFLSALFGWSFADYGPAYASLITVGWLAASLPSGPINNECRFAAQLLAL